MKNIFINTIIYIILYTLHNDSITGGTLLIYMYRMLYVVQTVGVTCASKLLSFFPLNRLVERPLLLSLYLVLADWGMGSLAAATAGRALVDQHASLCCRLVLEVQPHQEEGQEEDEGTEGVDTREGEEQGPAVASQVGEAVLEGFAERRHQQVEVPANDSDDEEIDGHGCRAHMAGGQVHNNGGGDAYPHLTNDV